MPQIPHERFFNREISWLEFNMRVLAEATDTRTPLIERVRFLAIVESNLDEFFMKRVGGLKRQLSAGVRQLTLDGATPADQLAAIRGLVQQMVLEQRRCLLEELVPELRNHGLHLLDYGELSDEERDHAHAIFMESIFPILTPLGVDPGHPFPFLSNLSLSLAVRLQVPGGEGERYARVKVPGNVPRWVQMPEPNRMVPIEQLIAHNLNDLFPGIRILEAQPFRITRNADIERNEEEADDLLELIEDELRHRKFADAVRVEVAEAMSEPMRDWLREMLIVNEDDLYSLQGPLNLRDLTGIDLPEATDLRWPPQTVITHPRLRPLEEDDSDTDIFQIIRDGDVLVHHPYHSFKTSVLRFLEEAAEDPNVLAIKQTLYRTAKNSPIIRALVRAANNGKQVAVLIEIKARFDEANNIEWVKVLENAGVHVTYGLVGLKTHTKTILVVRQDADGLRAYCHIGTGNYHTGTARLYTDVGLLTCNAEICGDLVNLFNFLTGHSRFHNYRHMLVAPVNMRERYLEMIEREIELHRPDEPGCVIAKMNQLEDREIIEALYRASQAGVQIDLIVRGFCCLRPGVPGLSENIRVMSTIGRFLEHSRIFYFRNGGDGIYIIGSADWMYRNLDRRVEANGPVLDPALKIELRDILDYHLSDTRQTWDLQPDGTYIRRSVESDDPGVQQRLMDALPVG